MFNYKKLKKWWHKYVLRHLNISNRVKKILWGIVFFLTIALIITIDLLPHQALKVGEVSQRDIEAPRTITFIDEEKTEEKRQEAAQSAPRVYEEDISVNNNIKDNLRNFFVFLKLKNSPVQTEQAQKQKNVGDLEYRIRHYNTLTAAEKTELVDNIKEKFNLDVTDQTITLLLNAPSEKLNKVEEETISIMDNQLKKRILPGEIDQARDEMAQRAMATDLDKDYRLAIADLLENAVRPNMVLNEQATIKRQKEAMDKVEPYTKTVLEGENILRKGDVVTKEDVKILEALGLQKPQVNYLNVIGLLVMILIIIVLANLYFYKYKNDFWEEQKNIVFLEIMIIIVLFLAKIIERLSVIFQMGFLPFLVPAAMASILTTILISTEIAVILTFFISVFVGLVFNYSYSVALISFIGGLVGIFSVSNVNQRNDLVRAGFNVSAVLIFSIIALSVEEINSWVTFLYYAGTGLMNGLLVAILANGLLPYLENTFDLTSSVKLLELSNPSQPLLKRLLVEAPGTYHHSVIVGNLAETAADNIGANSLLARVGAYYHDIGKMKRPYFFADNQFGGDNPHDKLSPNLSALIIKSHVKDGVEMAKNHGLPKVIIDIIKQHHGTNLISYFYQQAQKENKHDNVKKNDFRYDGPKPQSKEAALIMLADIVEAALRSKQFNKSNQNRIEGSVRDLIKNKLNEGQLDESDLTLKDLDIIVDSFVKVLTGIYHQRIDYPENLLKEMKRADNSDKS